MTTVTIETRSGKVLEPSRTDLAQAIQALPDGFHKVTIQEVKRGYTPTRYKYYWDHVLPTILMTCGNMIEELCEDGTFKPVTTTKQVHEFLKMKYCPTFIKTPSGIFQVPSSTTEISDRDFYGKFEDLIQSDFSSPPYGCDFMDRERWVAYMKEKTKKPKAEGGRFAKE